MAPLRLASPHPDVRWALVTALSSPTSDGEREQACARAWATVEDRARVNGFVPGSAALTSRRGTLLLARDGHRLAGALLRPGAVVSVARYELREALAADVE